MDPQWIKWARALQAIGQTGLHFADNDFDKQRYQQIQDIAAEILEGHLPVRKEEVLEIFSREFGYATPKVDVRGVVFRDAKVLLVREILDQGRWTVPGGWADVNEAPSEAVTREVFEESGFETRVIKIMAVYDREKQGHVPSFPYHIYKHFFLCEITGGSALTSSETSEVDFFDKDHLPELSVSRVTEKQIHRFFEHLNNPDLPTDYD